MTKGIISASSSEETETPLGPSPILIHLMEIREDLKELKARPNAGQTRQLVDDLTDVALCEIARKMYRARRRRDKFFPQKLFAEPAWDILLDTFVQQAGDGNTTIKAVCASSHVAPTTALRYIKLLKDEGLLTTWKHPTDRRSTCVRLSKDGYRTMRRYLLDGVSQENLPRPDHRI